MSSVDNPQWTQRLARWSHRLHTAHLEGIVGTLFDAFEPLSPLGAQLLWIAQPTLSLWMPREDIASLARLLEQPEGVSWLREQLAGPEDETREHEQY